MIDVFYIAKRVFNEIEQIFIKFLNNNVFEEDFKLKKKM